MKVENQHTPMRDLAVGHRVVLTEDVDRFPHFIARSGSFGTVVDRSDDYLAVKMDRHLPGCEEWDNEVVFTEETGTPPVLIVSGTITSRHIIQAVTDYEREGLFTERQWVIDLLGEQCEALIEALIQEGRLVENDVFITTPGYIQTKMGA